MTLIVASCVAKCVPPVDRAEWAGIGTRLVRRGKDFDLRARNLWQNLRTHPPKTMALSVGARLGPYEIVSLLGSGGMGEVYRARDSKLNRDVALKVLPDSFANDPERLARFQREAQLLASLNHPHIAHVYGLEEKARDADADHPDSDDGERAPKLREARLTQKNLIAETQRTQRRSFNRENPPCSATSALELK